ncbi:hypothetical protein QBC39DRAFT_437898 [Podospora conica]|nr:hypothetical protein QBC39DRAFT_437898 [Schizothecium conicum]
MSGLEPLAALGLACNVFQIVSFAREVCQVSKSVIETGDVPPPALASTLEDLAKVFREVQATTAAPNTKLTSCDQELIKIAKECSEAASDLKKELDKGQISTAKGKGKLSLSWGALKGVAGASNRRKKLEKLEKMVYVHQQALEARLLARTCTKVDAIEITQQKGFQKLDATLQSFVTLFSQGETRMAALLSQQTTIINDHITTKARELDRNLEQISKDTQRQHQEISQATVEVNANITTLTRRTDDKAEQDRKDARHARLLKSLKYETMNERRNQIEQPHVKTFHWIFEDDPRAADESEDSLRYGASDARNWIYDDSDSDESYDHGREQASERIRKAASGFIEWVRDPSSQTFWICGKPGSGKSTLMKFLAGNPQTLKLLDSATTIPTQTTILSHFIWTAGRPIEATVKGLLCSLLYQILLEQKASEVLIGRHPGTQMKDHISDWSDRELRHVLFDMLSHQDRRFCLFIDGLDEISGSHGQFEALDIVKDLRRVPFVKTCVSSRPEPILQHSLSQYPMFKVQDLTRFDIERFAANTIKNAFEGAQINLGEDSPEYDKILKRALPTDLSNLYDAMWDRLGDDKEIYQRDAANYFNLLLDPDMNPGMTESFFTNLENTHVEKDRLLVMVLAHDQLLTRRILEYLEHNNLNGAGFSIFLDSDLSRQLNQRRLRLEARCAGLLEVRRNTEDWELYTPTLRHNTPSWYLDKVDFVHRSALDFLGSQQGPEILLDKDQSTLETRHDSMALAMLTAYILSTDLDPGNEFTSPFAINFVRRMLRPLTLGRATAWSPNNELVRECGKFVARIVAGNPHSRARQVCQHYDLSSIMACCLPNDLLNEAVLSISVGSVSRKYATYLFISALQYAKYHKDYFREAVWLCNIARYVDLGFQASVCTLSPYSIDERRCRTFGYMPLTPLSITLDLLQYWSKPRFDKEAFLTRSPHGIGTLNLLRSLLLGGSNYEYLTYTTVIAFSLRVSSGESAIRPGIDVLKAHGDMRLAMGLLAADMFRWGQEDICQLLRRHLGEGPFDPKVTEMSFTPVPSADDLESDSEDESVSDSKDESDSDSKDGSDSESEKSWLSTTDTRKLARVESIFRSYYQEHLAPDSGGRIDWEELAQNRRAGWR